MNLSRKVILRWVKAHIGIKGNEVADRAVGMARQNNKIERFDLYASEYMSISKDRFFHYWNEYWQTTGDLTGKGLFLRSIKSLIRKDNLVRHLKRRRSKVVFHRLRIGHVGLNN